MFRKPIVPILAAVGLLALTSVAAAQDAPPGNIIASELNSPRDLAYDVDGSLLIAEAGIGGDIMVEIPEMGEASLGLTGSVISVAADGTKTPVVSYLPSGASGPEAMSVQAVLPTEDSIWLAMGDGGPMLLFNGSVVEIDRATMRIKTFIPLWAYEVANNTDETEEINSNPSRLVMDDEGTLYIVDTGANAILTWTETDGLQPWQVWNDNSVPMALAFADDGSYYVSFLGQGIAPGAGHVEHWSADGELIGTVEGLTASSDVLVASDGSVYATQMLQFGEEGPAPNSGSVVMLADDGTFTVVAEGLNFPYALEEAPSGSILVSTDAAFSAPASGTVVELSKDM